MQPTFSGDVVMGGLKAHGNFPLAVFAGLIAALIATLLWLGVTLVIGRYVEYGVLVVAAFVGLAIRLGGHGSSPLYGLLGAILTLLCCLPVAVLAAIQSATTGQFDLYTILTKVDFAGLINTILTQTTPPMYVVYGIGLLEAYVFSIRKPRYE